VIAEPPFDAGAVKLTVADALPAVAVTPVGEPGRIAVTTSVIVPLVKLACVSVLLSVPVTVKVYVPTTSGVPLITPVLEIPSPSGRLPLASVVENVYGAWPPVAVSDWLYAVSSVAEVSVVGVTPIDGGETVIVSVAGADVPLAFVAV